MSVRPWVVGGFVLAGLMAAALMVAFAVANSNPSIKDETVSFKIVGALSEAKREGNSIRLGYWWGRSTLRIQSADAELLKALQAAIGADRKFTLTAQLQGAHFDEDSGWPAFWVESLSVGDQQYGPFEPRVAWSWRKLRDEQKAVLRGMALQGNNRFNAALTEFNRSLDNDVLRAGQRGIAFAVRADLYQFKASQEFSEPGRDYFNLRALEDYTEAARARRKDPYLPLARARMLLLLGAYEDAVTAFEQAAALAKDAVFDVAIAQAALLRSLDRYPASLRALDQVPESNELRRGMKFHYHRGWTLLLMERHAEAEREFTNGLEAQKDWPWAYTGRACARHAMGDLPGARDDLMLMSVVYRAKSDADQARKADEDAALHSELLNNVRALERQEADPSAPANLTICERMDPDFDAPKRKRSKLLDLSRPVQASAG